MASDSEHNAEFVFALRVHGFYVDLVSTAKAGLDSAPDLSPEPDLGGKFLYAAQLDEDGRALVVASNIAGAASLCATADPAAQKQAVRDGVVDFLVSTLDEALRILKNEIRKRQTVAVCVASPPHVLECEMLERGVMPDLLRPSVDSAEHDRERRQQETPDGADPMAATALVVWSVASAPAQWLPKLDAIAIDCLESKAGSARRWIRLAPRYLGRLARATRLLVLDREFAASFIGRVRDRVESGAIATPVRFLVTFEEGNDELHFAPKDPSKAD
jgi:urocanate hydratase